MSKYYVKVFTDNSNEIEWEALTPDKIHHIDFKGKMYDEVRYGKWENIDVIHDRADAKITDWQQAQCSICRKWQTKPYLYGIVLDPYCPSCGAKMKKDDNEE